MSHTHTHTHTHTHRIFAHGPKAKHLSTIHTQYVPAVGWREGERPREEEREGEGERGREREGEGEGGWEGGWW